MTNIKVSISVGYEKYRSGILKTNVGKWKLDNISSIKKAMNDEGIINSDEDGELHISYSLNKNHIFISDEAIFNPIEEAHETVGFYADIYYRSVHKKISRKTFNEILKEAYNFMSLNQ